MAVFLADGPPRHMLIDGNMEADLGCVKKGFCAVLTCSLSPGGLAVARHDGAVGKSISENSTERPT